MSKTASKTTRKTDPISHCYQAMLTFVSTPLAHAKAPFNSAQPFELLLPPDAPLFPSLTALVIVSLSDNTGQHLFLFLLELLALVCSSIPFIML